MLDLVQRKKNLVRRRIQAGSAPFQ